MMGKLDYGASVANSNNLCSYFWGSLWNIITACVILVLAWFFFTVVGEGLLESSDIAPEGSILPYAWLVGIGSILLALAAVVGIICCTVLPYVILRDKSKSKEPSVVVEYLKSRKEKYCPRINWK